MAVQGAIAQTFTLPVTAKKFIGTDGDGNPVDLTGNTDFENDAQIKDGSFLTSIDLYFDVVDLSSNQNLVKVEIRNTVNGYPGKTVVGYASKYLTSEDGTAVGRAVAATATNFRFNSPVLLNASTEYCIVIKTQSSLTSVWSAEQGGTDRTSGLGGLISSPPTIGGSGGSLFTAENDKTYVAAMNKDLKFRLYKAVFTTDVSTLNLRSKQSKLAVEIGKANAGLPIRTFKFSPYILIKHPNHGMYGDGQKVVVSGVSGPGGSNTLAGIPISEINTQADVASTSFSTTHDVHYPTQDTYFIKVASNATESTDGGGYNVKVSSNVQYDFLYTNLNAIQNQFTKVASKIKTTTGTSINNTISSQLLGQNTSSDYYQAVGALDTAFSYINTDTVTTFTNAKTVQSTVNSTQRTLQLDVELYSADSRFSPVIPVESYSNGTVNRIKLLRNKTGNQPDDSDLADKYPLLNSKRANDSDYLSEGDSDNAGKQAILASYIAALTASRNDHADYITKITTLATPADRLVIKFQADLNPSNVIEIAFKAKRIGDSADIDAQEWEDFKLNTFINETNYGSFSSAQDYKEYSAEHAIGEDFSEFRIRLRMKTQNEAYVPRLRNLRIIAVA